MVWHSLGSILVLPPIICRIPDILYFIRAVFYIFRSASHANHIYFLLIKKTTPTNPLKKYIPKAKSGRRSRRSKQGGSTLGGRPLSHAARRLRLNPVAR